MNVEVAHELAERKRRRPARWEELTELLEAVALGLVAVATAWSEYQAARWDGRETLLYGRATTIGIEADEKLTLVKSSSADPGGAVERSRKSPMKYSTGTPA
jgi:hypothetical protein